MTDIILLGAGGHARDTIKNIRDFNLDRPRRDRLEIVCCVDDVMRAAKGELLGIPVVRDLAVLGSRARRNARVLCAVGDPLNRMRFVKKAARYSPDYFTLVHPSVRLPASVKIGKGSSIFALSAVSECVTIGGHVSCNYACTVSHDTVLGDFVTLCPGVNVSGRVEVGEGVLMGTNSASANHLSIGPWSVIGAGAAVTKSVAGRSVLAPARPALLGRRDMERAYL